MTDLYSLVGKRIWVPGHRGMVGSALCRRLPGEHVGEVLTAGRDELDLRDQAAVRAWAKTHRPDAVFVPAAKVGGIVANNSYPAEFLYDNLMIAANVIHASYEAGVEKLLFLGSSCIYPKFAEQPMREDALLTGPLEPTNEWYAVAKIAGLKLCEAFRKQYGADFISAMPTNLYGPGDNYDLQNSHVLPALIRKAHEAKGRGEHTMEIWGTGSPLREFLHVDDCADGLIYLMKHYSDDQHINLGSGSEIAIEDLARMVMEVVGLEGHLVKDESKPDGTPRKLMDSSRLLGMGWRAQIGLRAGIASTYQDFLAHHAATA